MPQKKILVIDDERSYHNQFSRILVEENYFIECVQTGEIAIKMIELNNYDLIILDLVLKENKISGLKTLEKIRKINSDVYIVITSAYATTEQAIDAILHKGAQTYIKKPFNIEELRQTVKSGLKWKKPYLEITNENIKTIIKFHEQSIIKRCFLTGSIYCPLQIREQRKTIFIGMPFKDNKNHLFKNIYNLGIKPAIKELDLIPWRADEQLNDIVTMCKVCQGIQEAKYSIIDITTWNANVIFEFGLILGLAKRPLLLKSKNTPIPADLKGFEYIEYDNNYSKLKMKIIEYLKKMIKEDIPKKARI